MTEAIYTARQKEIKHYYTQGVSARTGIED